MDYLSFFLPHQGQREKERGGRETEIPSYMHPSEKPKENRVTIDFAELFEWLPMVLSCGSDCLVYRAIVIFIVME